MVIEKLNLRFDTNRVWHDCLTLIGKYGWGDRGQICFTHTQDAIGLDKIFSGCGTLNKDQRESDFSVFNEELKDSYLANILQGIPYKMGRIRLMRMLPRTCYSVHRDSTMRLHLPIQTNPQALILFPDHSVITHLPADGDMYLVNTTEKHSAMNGSLQNRYHLVAALI